jgi:eukaryotic-like serine/threonine-protein kinase
MPNEDPDPRLLEAALAITDRGTLDWDVLRHELPAEAGTLAELEALAGIRDANAGVEGDGASVADEAIAFRWGRLEVHRLLGRGSFGEVWAARDPSLRREVALKLQRAGDSGDANAWLREGRRLARVRHPNVVTVHGADRHEGRAGIWMDLVRGRSLEELLAMLGPLAPARRRRSASSCAPRSRPCTRPGWCTAT